MMPLVTIFALLWSLMLGMGASLYQSRRLPDGNWKLTGARDGKPVVVVSDLGDDPSVEDCLKALDGKGPAPRQASNDDDEQDAPPNDPLAGNVATAAGWAKQQTDADVLREALARETAKGDGQRKGVVTALERRIQELKEPKQPEPPNPEPEKQEIREPGNQGDTPPVEPPQG